MEGWVKLHREIKNWEWFQDSKTVHFFLYLLVNASHNEFKWKGKTFLPGQLPFGYRAASIETGLSVQSIRSCVKRLISTNEITHEGSRQGSVITILKWNKYQCLTNNSTTEQQTINKRSTHTKNEKNEKNDKNNYTLQAVMNLWNERFPKKPAPHSIGASKHLKNYQTITGYVLSLDKWAEVFDRAKKSDFFSLNPRLDFLWCLDYDNFLKIDSGRFDDTKKLVNENLESLLGGEK